MKLKYIIPAAIAALTMLASCSENDTLELDNIKVSQSYIAIPEKGGDVTVEITASEDWTFDIDFDVEEKKLDDEKGVVKYYVPTKQLDLKDNSWLSVSARSGSKGKSKVTFHADATTESRSSALQIKAGDKIQNVIVAQTAGAQEVKVVSVKDVIAGTDGKTYRVKGFCTAISNTNYGNWDMADSEGNSIMIYGTKDATGAYNWNSFNIAVGDEVVVEGPRKTYGSTIELVDATFISVKKALLACDDVNKFLAKEATSFELKVAQKGEGLSFESQSDWLTIEGNGYTSDGKGNLIFKVNVEENTTGSNRTGSIVLKSTKKDDETILPVSITQLGSSAVAEGGIAAINTVLKTSTDKKKPAKFDYILKNAKVTYKNGSNVFVEDETGGLFVYGNDVLKVGQVINGRVWGEGYAYSNLPQATAFNLQFAKVTTPEDSKVEPMSVTLAELNAKFDYYMNRYVKISDAKVETAVDAKYPEVKSNGKITDGTNTFGLRIQSTGKFNGNKIYMYIQAAKDAKVDVVCIPSVFKSDKQLLIYEQKWVEIKK
ncbi:MAG: BACON domain-containing carbohydrate-binding protein [Bacteroidales bacterium]|nr:BACON domain-containing carbohydrate-binding protein [Bacteroidales bacterium]